MKTKKCSNCFHVKNINEFYKKLNSEQSRCKQCNVEVVQGYRLRKRYSLLDNVIQNRLRNGTTYNERT